MRFLSVRKPRFVRARGRRARSPSLLVTLLLFGVCALLVAWLDTSGMRTQSGTARVHDGDTVTVEGERIRLSGIDAFELDQMCMRGDADYPCGQEAKAALARFAGNQAVECTGGRRDRYGRMLAVCSANGVDLNERMVTAGWALSYGAYKITEQRARLAGRGAWQGDFIAPSVWRARQGQPVEARHDIVSRMLEQIGQYLFGGAGKGTRP